MGQESQAEMLSRRMSAIKSQIRAALPQIIAADRKVSVIWYGSAAREQQGISPEGESQHEFSPDADGDLLVSPSDQQHTTYMRIYLVEELEAEFTCLEVNVVRLEVMDKIYREGFRQDVLKQGIQLVDQGNLFLSSKRKCNTCSYNAGHGISNRA